MESIKSNIDLIFDDWNSSQPKITQKRLSFDFMNNSGETTRNLDSGSKPKKRKFNEVDFDKNTSLTKNDSNSSLNTNSSFLSPSWETKLLKADLLEAQSRISQLKKEIEHQNTIQTNIELKYSQKEQSLEKEMTHYKTKVQELEKIVTKMRKKEHASKEELVKTKNQMSTLKQSCDEKLYHLQSEKKQIEQDLRFELNSLQNEVGELQRQNDELEMHFQECQEELDVMKETQDELREKAGRADALKNELDEETQKLQNAISENKKLKFDLECCGEWKELSKVTQARMNGFAELEKEVVRLRQDTKNLRDSMGNKLLLEEQVFDLKSRLEKFENSNVDGIGLQVKLDAVSKDLDEWLKVGQDYCPKNSQVNPTNLRSYIEKLFESTLLLSNEKSSAVGENSSAQTILGELKLQNDLFQKQIESAKKSIKNYQTIIYRLQKKMQLITNERDSLKMLLDNYEKDLTITQTTSSNSQQDQQTKIRLEMLEKTVIGLKDLNGRLEQELKEAKESRGDADPSDEGIVSYNSDQLDNLRKELFALRAENEKLNKRRNELEIENENLRLRSNNMNGIGGFEDNRPIKILHFANNPADLAYANHTNDIDKLKAEIERLKIRNKKLEEGHDELTKETMNMTMGVKENAQLKTQVQSLEAKIQQIKDVYKQANHDFREVCLFLFGYRIDRVGNRNYRIISTYADSPNQYLNFRYSEEGGLDMLESDYSLELSDMMRTHLTQENSLPAFLSALTLDLYSKITIVS